MHTIYADNNATTCVAPEVFEAITPFLTSEYFNPSSMYSPAQRVGAALKQARADVARFVGAGNPAEIVFTSCATESNNLAIQGVLAANRQRRHIITTAVEHPAILEVCKDLSRGGIEVTFLPVDRQGRLDVVDLIRALRRDTLLVTVMHANNETGVVFPVEELARVVKETDPEVVFHTDATQAAGKLPLDLSGSMRHVDLLSFSGHKLHAPKGVGALFVRGGARWRPTLIGGHQEHNRRAGTENVAFIVGLARACELAGLNQAAEVEHVRRLRDRLEQELVSAIPYVEANGRGAPRLPNTLNLSCHFIEGEGILYQLDEHGICASSGSACTSGSLEPSHVLRAMNVPFTAVHGSVRFSLSRYNTEEEISTICSVFPGIVANLRKLSPYWDTAAGGPRPEAESMAHPDEEPA